MTAQVLSIRPGACKPCKGTGWIRVDAWGRVLFGLDSDSSPCLRCAGTGLSTGPKLARARSALRIIFGGLAVALVCWTGSAQAAELDVCHAYAESRYQEVMQATAGEADFEAQRLYEDAYEDCEWGGRGFVWRNAPLSDIAGDSDLIVDPWAID